MVCHYSQNCTDLVKECEELRLEAYPDPGTGGEPWTIGWGHTPAKPGQTITEVEAEALLKSDLDFAGLDVFRWFHNSNLTQGMFDALTSLAMNVGIVPAVAPHLTEDIRAGNFVDAAKQFLDIDRDRTGRVMPGLAIRRQRESALFLS